VRAGGGGGSFKPNHLKLSKNKFNYFIFSKEQKEKKFPKQKLKSGLRKEKNQIKYQPPWLTQGQKK
jgi:hypothetical protein